MSGALSRSGAYACIYRDVYSRSISVTAVYTSKLKQIVNFKKGIGIERCAQFTTVTLIYEKST